LIIFNWWSFLALVDLDRYIISLILFFSFLTLLLVPFKYFNLFSWLFTKELVVFGSLKYWLLRSCHYSWLCLVLTGLLPCNLFLRSTCQCLSLGSIIIRLWSFFLSYCCWSFTVHLAFVLQPWRTCILFPKLFFFLHCRVGLNLVDRTIISLRNLASGTTQISIDIGPFNMVFCYMLLLAIWGVRDIFDCLNRL